MAVPYSLVDLSLIVYSLGNRNYFLQKELLYFGWRPYHERGTLQKIFQAVDERTILIIPSILISLIVHG